MSFSFIAVSLQKKPWTVERSKLFNVSI